MCKSFGISRPTGYRLIDLTKIKKLKLENWTGQKGIVYRKVSLTDTSSKLTFTAREFENFETLTNEISNIENRRKEIDFEQAKANFIKYEFQCLSTFWFSDIFGIQYNLE